MGRFLPLVALLSAVLSGSCLDFGTAPVSGLDASDAMRDARRLEALRREARSDAQAAEQAERLASKSGASFGGLVRVGHFVASYAGLGLSLKPCMLRRRTGICKAVLLRTIPKPSA